jgi:putative cell wall-binding protein
MTNHFSSRSRRVIGLLAATVGALALVAVPLPASADPITPPPVLLTQNDSPDSDQIGAYWGDYRSATGGFAVADDTTSLVVTLPAEVSEQFGRSWTFTLTPLAGYPEISGGAVETASAGTITVPIPKSLLVYSDVRLAVATTAQPDPALRVSFSAILHVHPELSGATSTVRMERATATDWAHFSRYSALPAVSTATPGSLITVSSPPGTWTVGPSGDWAQPSPVTMALSDENGMISFGRVKGTASSDGSSVTFQVPSVAAENYWPYFPEGTTSRTVRLSISFLEGPLIGESLYGDSLSVGATLTLVPAEKPAVDRIDGADRFAVAVAVSQEAYPDGAESAFLVTGANYPDALSAGPAAVHREAPLLLTRGDSLPPETAAELARLEVRDVYVVGGVNSVSEAVVKQVEATGVTVHRIGGADRYAASRALAAETFGGSGSGLVYVATGANFPDALAAGGAAGHADAPVILVNGGAASLDAATKQQLAALGVTSIKIAGGPASVSPGIERDLAAIAPTTRLSGTDRIQAAAAINLDAYGSSDRAFLVTGYAFPDALTGSAWAGHLGVPLYVSLPNCVPGAVADAAARQGVGSLTLIGGPASLAPAVQEYTLCAAH